MSRFDYTWRYVYLKVCSNIIRHFVCIPREFESTWKYSPCSGKVQVKRGNETSRVRFELPPSRVITLLGRTSSITNEDVRNCKLRRPWSRISRRFERGEIRESKGWPSPVQGKERFFFYHAEGRRKKEKKKAEECTRQDEGGQARVTRWIEYLRGTPFAWKIERCSSIKVALHEKKNNELEKRNSYDFLFHFLSLFFSWIFSTCISNRSVKINNFRKIRTIGDRFETLRIYLYVRRETQIECNWKSRNFENFDKSKFVLEFLVW